MPIEKAPIIIASPKNSATPLETNARDKLNTINEPPDWNLTNSFEM